MATREAERLGMRFETQLTGPPGYPVEVSHLMRGDTEVAEGGGRGSGPAGVAGGHFEALERYFMSARVNRHAAAGAASMKRPRTWRASRAWPRISSFSGGPPIFLG